MFRLAALWRSDEFRGRARDPRMRIAFALMASGVVLSLLAGGAGALPLMLAAAVLVVALAALVVAAFPAA